MTRHIALGLTSILLTLSGCDPEGGTNDDAQFRSDVGYVQVRTTTASFSSKGCDPPFPIYKPGMSADEADERWQDMMYTQARMVADETLRTAFLAQPDVEAFCHAACKKEGGEWNGRAELVDVEHDFGRIEIVGECPNDTLATAIPTDSVGDVGCGCE